MSRRRSLQYHERYDLERSPFAHMPTQRDVARLVRQTPSDLQLLATPQFKDQFIVRRTIPSGTKSRDLVYPVARLRGVHERLKIHLSKIIQPSYLMSPRKGRAQRDNAAVHLDATQYLTLDLKQFYPSTTRGMIRSSLAEQFGMAIDVAGLIAHLATADDTACLGSPLTPVLASLVHRPMFDAIADLCEAEGLRYTVWVDDLTISGENIPGDLVAAIRKIIAKNGLKSHKLQFRTGKRPVFITGVGVVGANLVVRRNVEVRSQELWGELKAAQTYEEIDTASTRLLSHLGGIRYVVGSKSWRGQKISNEMNSIRQKRAKVMRINTEQAVARTTGLKRLTPEEAFARKDEIEAVGF